MDGFRSWHGMCNYCDYRGDILLVSRRDKLECGVICADCLRQALDLIMSLVKTDKKLI